MSENINVSKEELKAFALKLREIEKDLLSKKFFYQEHKMSLEALSKDNQLSVVRDIISKFQNEFNLGVVNNHTFVNHD